MREIRFRAWDKEKEQLLYMDVIAWHAPSNWRDFYVLQESTGLKDKHGKKIYEGDKVRWYTWDGYWGEAIVEFMQGRFYPVATGCLEYERFDEKQGFEVIGNIYEEEQKHDDSK